MSSDSENIVYSKNVLEFVTIGAEFSSYMENFNNEPRVVFINRLHKTLTLLYLKASLLPSVDPILDDSIEKFLTEDDWIRLKNMISEKLGSHDLFVEVSEPEVQIDFEETSVTISECLADIYQDISDFLRLYQIGSFEIMNDSLWECKQNFERYWGSRLLVVLTTFHNLIYGSNNFENEGDNDM